MRDVVWPLMAPLLGGGELHSLELDSDATGLDFDREAGIDGYQAIRGRPLRAFASRVQWKFKRGRAPAWLGPPPLTFSIRLETARGNSWTECAKRLDAYRERALLPTLVVQSYLEKHGGPAQAIGICEGQTLYGYVADCESEGREWEIRSAPDGAQFIAVSFKEVPCWRWFGSQRWKADPQLSFDQVSAA